MLYTSVKIGEKVYNLRLIRKYVNQMKADTGVSPLQILDQVKQDFDVGPFITLFYYACKWENPEMTIEDAETAYDDFISMGYSFDEFGSLGYEILRVSGFIKGVDKNVAMTLKSIGINIPEDKIIDLEKLNEIKKNLKNKQK